MTLSYYKFRRVFVEVLMKSPIESLIKSLIKSLTLSYYGFDFCVCINEVTNSPQCSYEDLEMIHWKMIHYKPSSTGFSCWICKDICFGYAIFMVVFHLWNFCVWLCETKYLSENCTLLRSWNVYVMLSWFFQLLSVGRWLIVKV